MRVAVILPQVNSSVLNAVKENVYVHRDKERETVFKRQLFEKNIKLRVLQKFQENSSSQNQDKEGQLQKICDSQSQNNISKKHEKQGKMDHTKRKKFVPVIMRSKNHIFE